MLTTENQKIILASVLPAIDLSKTITEANQQRYFCFWQSIFNKKFLQCS